MKITIKNVKVAKFASEETMCFECSVYVDGKRAFVASNDGRGGCNLYHGDRALIDAAEKWATENYEHATGIEDLDAVIQELLNQREVEKYVKRLLKKFTIATSGDGAPVEIFQWKLTAEQAEAVDGFMGRVEETHPGHRVLNWMPFDEAVSIVRSSA
tara:strand:+ start:195 stop:665 length:471 start_codon:yes stop_codon:yes gene_type:complete